MVLLIYEASYRIIVPVLLPAERVSLSTTMTSVWPLEFSLVTLMVRPCCYFMCFVGSMIKLVVLYTEIYCRVGFEDHLLDDPMQDLELPEAVPPGVETNRKAKSFSQNLK